MAIRTVFRTAPAIPVMALLLAGCAYDGVSGQAPRYGEGADYVYGEEALGPEGYDGEWNPAWTGVEQPGDLFGGEDVASVEVFYEPLAPYGRWVETRWGRAFAPEVDRGWRPYTNGRWTEYRLWISDDPWGWATDHYGRWAHDDRIGWVWVPGTRWGPHWVAFRENEQYAGWAPIPPQVDYDIGIGFGGGFGYDNFNSWYGPSWVWAPAGAIFLPGLNRRILPYGGGLNYWQATRWQHWTPWTPNRGWAGAPGRNYWRGASPIGNRIGGAIGGRPGFGQPYGGGYRRPQQGWNGQPGLQRPPGDGRPGWQQRQGQRPDGVAPNSGNRPDRGQRPDRVNRPDRAGGYAPRPAYGGGAPNRNGNPGAPVIGRAIGGTMGARPAIQGRPATQPRPAMQGRPAMQPRPAMQGRPAMQPRPQMQPPARPMAAPPPVMRQAPTPPPAPQVRQAPPPRADTSGRGNTTPRNEH